MAAKVLITILLAVSLTGCMHDTLADMGVEVSPELQAQGIDPGQKHDVPCPQFPSAEKPFRQISVPRGR